MAVRVTLTSAQRTAAITEIRNAAAVTLSATAAGRIVDRLCSTDSTLGKLLDLPASGGYGGGYS
jgi:hypothetical protein